VIPWDFIWVEGGKRKRTENGYRSVNVPFYLPFLNCCGPLWGRDVYCPDQTLSGERVSWAFHTSRRIQESSGEGWVLGLGRLGPYCLRGPGGGGGGERYCGITWAFCLGRVLTIHEGHFIWADRVLFTLTVVEPWAVCLFSVLSGPYRSPPIPLDHLKDLSKGISDDRGGGGGGSNC
jgi:hypothetical protein